MAHPESPVAPIPPEATGALPVDGELALETPTQSGIPDWPAWTAPAALFCGLVLALFGALLVDIPAAIFGVSINSNNLPPGLALADTLVQDAAFVLAVVLFAAMGGRRVRAWQFGLRPVPVWPAVWRVGVVLGGFYVFSAAWGAALDLKGKEKLLDQLGANENVALLIGATALTCVVAPICEELMFRGYMFTALRNWRGPWLAAIVTGLLFGGVHATSAPAAYLVPLAALGFGLCLLYWRTGSLYPCIATHCINNSIAFGVLENWGWQIPVLMAAALTCIFLLFAGARRIGLLDGDPAPAVAA